MQRSPRPASFILIGAIGAVLALGAVALRGGISAQVEPSKAEAWVARRLRGAAIPGEARRVANPIPVSADILARGRHHFADHCASCHGNDGSGGTKLGRSLYPRAPDMRLPVTQELTDGELFYIIENGVKLTGMPAWGESGEARESWELVHFIRHLPQLTPAEKLEMARLNPRGPEEWMELQEEDRFLRDAPVPDQGQGHR